MAGGGVGEAMLIGAAVGAGTGGIMSAAKDEDPLKGALMGAAMGAAGGGIGSGIGGVLGEAATPAIEGTTSQLSPNAISAALGSDAAKTAALTGQSSIPAFSSSGSLLGPGGSSIPGFSTAGGSLLGTGSTGVAAAGGAPASWAAQGIGQGFAPHLANAQAYGAGLGGGVMGLLGSESAGQNNMAPAPAQYTGPLSKFKYDPSTFRPSLAPGYAEGGIASLATGGVQQTDMFPQSQMDKTQFATPSQMPISREIIGSDYDATISPYTGDLPRFAHGGISDLGGYSDGGRLLRGPGDGMSDDIPASIGRKQPARLADGEFVVPADVVSGIGNGSTDAGAKKLYSMMDKVRVARTGSKKQGKQIKADKMMPEMASGGVAHYDDGGTTTTDMPKWFSDWLSSQQAQQMPTLSSVSPSFQPTGFDANYYNPSYWKGQLPDLQSKLKELQQPTFNAAWYLQQNPDVARAGVDPWAHYQAYGMSEGRTPFEGGKAGQQVAAFSDAKAIKDLQGQIDFATQRANTTGLAYDPYTVAARPSASEPQFYGNIYRPSYEDFSTPGYTLTGGNLGQWNNVAGEAQRAAQPASMGQQITQAYLQNLGRAPDTEGFNYWMQNSGSSAPAIVNAIAKSPEAEKIQEAPKEEKKRSGGIAALRRA